MQLISLDHDQHYFMLIMVNWLSSRSIFRFSGVIITAEDTDLIYHWWQLIFKPKIESWSCQINFFFSSLLFLILGGLWIIIFLQRQHQLIIFGVHVRENHRKLYFPNYSLEHFESWRSDDVQKEFFIRSEDLNNVFNFHCFFRMENKVFFGDLQNIA